MIVALTCAGILALGGITEFATGWLKPPNQTLFVVCGSVAPLFGLAVFVDIGLVMAPAVAHAGATSAIREATKTFVRINAAMLTISEGASLIAVGTRSATAFLVTCSALPWAAQLYVLVATTYHRAGIRKLGAQ